MEFVNNFLSLFYIAFVLGDIRMLRSQLMAQLIIFSAVQNLQETLYPFIKRRWKIFSNCCGLFKPPSPSPYKKMKPRRSISDIVEEDVETYDNMNIEIMEQNDERIDQNKYETTLDEYNSTYEDYLELYIQFGYVVLFASVEPLAAFWALIFNVIEIRLDAFKLCKMYKRPFAKRAKNTGAWLLAFGVLSVMAIITNCSILYMQPEIK